MDVWNQDEAVARVRAELRPFQQRLRWFGFGAAATVATWLLLRAIF